MAGRSISECDAKKGVMPVSSMTKPARAFDATNPILARVLGAARTVFLRAGYQGASMDAIAREAGGSKGTLYAYFANKENLFAAVVADECRRQAAVLEKLDAERLPIGLALRQVGIWLIDFLLRPDVMALRRIVVAEAHHFPELGRTFFEHGPAKIQSMVAEFLGEPIVQRELNIPNTEIAAELFLVLVKGRFQFCTELGYARPNVEERDLWVDAAVDLFLAGYDRSGHCLRGSEGLGDWAN